MNLYANLTEHLFLPAANALTNYKVTGQYHHQMQMEKTSLAEIQRIQQQKLHDLVQYGYDNVPFYRERFLASGINPQNLSDSNPLGSLPPTTKFDVMSNFPDRITAQGVDRKNWRYVATSGTSRQIIGLHDLRKTNINRAASLRRHKLTVGHPIGNRSLVIPAQMCSQQCGQNHQSSASFSQLMRSFAQADFRRIGRHFYSFAYNHRHRLIRRLTLPAFENAVTNISEVELDRYLQSIALYRPVILEALPLYLHMLAKRQLDSKTVIPKIPVVSPHGGSMTPLMKQEIREAIGREVFDKYGSAELGEIGTDCELHDGIHGYMDLYYFEFCRQGRSVQPGELGKLYITDLENRALPFIRYEIGDVGRFYMDDHGCGRSTIRFHIEGRVDETLVNSQGSVYSSDQVYDFFHSQDVIDNFQLIEQSKGDFQLLCVPRRGKSLPKEKIENHFRTFYDSNARITLFEVKNINAEDGGKFRFVKSCSHDAL